MARKNKHQILATRIKEMLTYIEEFLVKVRKFNVIQFHFYEKLLMPGRPLMSRVAFASMTKAHAIGMQHYSPSNDVRESCKQYACMGFIIQKSTFMPKEVVFSKDVKGIWVVPWALKTVLPSDDDTYFQKKSWEILLYCPDSSELSNEIDWFEQEDIANSFSYQLASICDVMEKDKVALNVIYSNVVQPALPLFKEAVTEWNKITENEDHDYHPRDLKIIYQTAFAPDDTTSIAIAYEKVRRILRERKFRNYQRLMKIWRNKLKEKIFQNVPWDENQQHCFLEGWEKNIFEIKSHSKKPSEGRWDQSQSVDKGTAAKFISYFIDKFLADPTHPKAKMYGEVACVLWTLIAIAQNNVENNVHIYDVVGLTSSEIDIEGLCVLVQEQEIPISSGLCQLLTILKGSGTGKRNKRLFEHISEERIQDALKDASKDILGGFSSPVLTGSFLIFPHLHEGIRMTRNERQTSRITKKLKFLPPYTRKDIKKVLQKLSVPI